MTGASRPVPWEAATLERARSLCSEACYTVELQCRRLRSTEPEDKIFIFRPWADFQFLVIALRRLKRSAEIAARIPRARDSIRVALAEFDGSLPFLSKLRNVGEHIDAYAVDDPKRHHGDVQRTQLQVGTWGHDGFTWLGHSLDYDVALRAAGKLFQAVRDAAGPAV